jgi:hypothetical protein
MPEKTLPDSQRSVFINCPYDPEYEPLYDALVFTIVCCGFTPRSATESGKVSVSRMERIFHAINTSAFSIHDLSRCHGEGEKVLARFNMPFELGIAMFRSQKDGSDQHDWLVLVPENAPYERFISDLAGYDPKKYDGKVESIVRSVMSWLMTQPGAIPGISPGPVIANLDKFRKGKIKLKTEWNEIPWTLLLKLAAESAPDF